MQIIEFLVRNSDISITSGSVEKVTQDLIQAESSLNRNNLRFMNQEHQYIVKQVLSRLQVIYFLGGDHYRSHYL